MTGIKAGGLLVQSDLEQNIVKGQYTRTHTLLPLLLWKDKYSHIVQFYT